MGQRVRIEAQDAEGKAKAMSLNTDTGEITPIRKLSTMDWLLKYADIGFKSRDEEVTAQFTNLKIKDSGTLYEAEGAGETANEAVKDLADDIKNEVVVVTTDSGEEVEYIVDDELRFRVSGK